MKAGWKTVKLGEVAAEFIVPQRDKPKKLDGKIPWCRIEDIDGIYLSGSKSGKGVSTEDVEAMPLRIFPQGTVIVSCSADLGRCAITSRPLVTNQTFLGVVPSESIDAKYLYYLFRSKADQLNEMATGATIKYLSKDKFASLEIPLPPLAEQKRIVALLDKAFAGIDEAMAKAEANQANAEALLKSHLHATFRTLKPGWHESKLGSVGKVSMCKRILKEQTSPAGDIPFYKIGTFGKQPDAYIPSSIYEDFRDKYPFPNKGDILISAAGTIGRRVRYNGEPAYFQDSNIVWIDNDERLVLNDYLYHAYSACEWNSTSGATISRLYNDDLRNVDIMFPPSQSEQKALAKAMDEVSDEIRKLSVTLQLRLNAHSKLKSSLLAQAFAGELTA